MPSWTLLILGWVFRGWVCWAWICGAWICWAWISSWLVGRLVLLGFTFVFNISYVARVVISFVVHNLSAAVGEKDPVRSGNVTLIVSGLLVGVVIVGRIVLNGPGEVLGHRSLSIF